MYFVAYLDPLSLMTEDWKVMGRSPTDHPWDTMEEAVKFAKELHRTMYYDVRVIRFCPFHREQDDSRQQF